jgi:hypothetical protein
VAWVGRSFLEHRLIPPKTLKPAGSIAYVDIVSPLASTRDIAAAIRRA